MAVGLFYDVGGEGRRGSALQRQVLVMAVEEDFCLS
jgi:hypothetical protein